LSGALPGTGLLWSRVSKSKGLGQAPGKSRHFGLGPHGRGQELPPGPADGPVPFLLLR
jgi:hypothetical protein